MNEPVDEIFQLQETFLSSLHEAIRRGIIFWKITQNDNRVIFSVQVEDSLLKPEFVYFPTSANETHGRVLANISGLGTYFSVSIGTRSYDIISSMLSMQISGWSEGRLSSIKKLRPASAKIQSLL